MTGNRNRNEHRKMWKMNDNGNTSNEMREQYRIDSTKSQCIELAASTKLWVDNAAILSHYSIIYLYCRVHSLAMRFRGRCHRHICRHRFSAFHFFVQPFWPLGDLLFANDLNRFCWSRARLNALFSSHCPFSLVCISQRNSSSRRTEPDERSKNEIERWNNTRSKDAKESFQNVISLISCWARIAHRNRFSSFPSFLVWEEKRNFQRRIRKLK